MRLLGRATNSYGGRLHDAILALGPIETRANRFGDTAYFYGRKGLGHYHLDGSYDIYVGRPARDQATEGAIGAPVDGRRGDARDQDADRLVHQGVHQKPATRRVSVLRHVRDSPPAAR